MEFEKAARDFSRDLGEPEPSSRVHARRWTWLIGLVVLCLVPRCLMAWRIDVLCRDGVFYLEHSQALARGDLDAGLGKLRLNTYPLILVALHRLGLAWEQVGEVWGVLIASLTVLPLFGWVRRQFNDAVASGAGVLYALHPKWIEWSPEMVRDQTFWFLAAWTLFAGWQAVSRVSRWWYVLAGCGFTLALFTRFEGWFLLLPLVLWTWWRWGALRVGRGRLVQGAVLGALALPLLVVATNLTWLRDKPGWELGSFQRLQYVVLWAKSLAPAPKSNALAASRAQVEVVPTATSDSASSVVSRDHLVPKAVLVQTSAPTAPPSTIGDGRMSTSRLVFIYFNTLRRGMDAVFGLLLLFGIWRWRHVWARREHQPLFCLALCVLGGIWVHLWYAQESSSRYVLTIALVGIPFATLGWYSFCVWVQRVHWRLAGCVAHPRVILGITLSFWVVWSGANVLGSNLNGRRQEAALGNWIRQECGAEAPILVVGRCALVGYYAQGRVEALPPDAGLGQILAGLADDQLRLAIISRKHVSAETCESVLSRARLSGFELVRAERLPWKRNAEELLVLKRTTTPAHWHARRRTHKDG